MIPTRQAESHASAMERVNAELREKHISVQEELEQAVTARSGREIELEKAVVALRAHLEKANAIILQTVQFAQERSLDQHSILPRCPSMPSAPHNIVQPKVPAHGPAGHVGLQLTEELPRRVMPGHKLVDRNHLCQGETGYSNACVLDGDILKRVDDVDVQELSLRTLHKLLTGDEDTKVKLCFERRGTEESGREYTVSVLRHRNSIHQHGKQELSGSAPLPTHEEKDSSPQGKNESSQSSHDSGVPVSETQSEMGFLSGHVEPLALNLIQSVPPPLPPRAISPKEVEETHDGHENRSGIGKHHICHAPNTNSSGGHGGTVSPRESPRVLPTVKMETILPMQQDVQLRTIPTRPSPETAPGPPLQSLRSRQTKQAPGPSVATAAKKLVSPFLRNDSVEKDDGVSASDRGARAQATFAGVGSVRAMLEKEVIPPPTYFWVSSCPAQHNFM